jgi:hypothetical protein
MNPIRLILLVGAALTVLGTSLFLKKEPLLPHLVAQNVNEYLGPKKRPSSKAQMVQVQILVNDDPSPQGVQIESVSFNQKNLTLKPRDIYGFRAESSFQVPPGKYKLKWKVQRDRSIWPRTLSHEEEVNVDPRDMWIQITIRGEEASIS